MLLALIALAVLGVMVLVAQGVRDLFDEFIDDEGEND